MEEKGILVTEEGYKKLEQEFGLIAKVNSSLKSKTKC